MTLLQETVILSTDFISCPFLTFNGTHPYAFTFTIHCYLDTITLPHVDLYEPGSFSLNKEVYGQ